MASRPVGGCLTWAEQTDDNAEVMQAPLRIRPVTRSAALLALATLVSLSVAVPGGAQAQMLGGQVAAASQFIARLNEAARTLAGPRDQVDVKPRWSRRPAPSARVHRPVRRCQPPVFRGALALGHRLDLSRLYLPPPLMR